MILLQVALNFKPHAFASILWLLYMALNIESYLDPLQEYLDMESMSRELYVSRTHARSKFQMFSKTMKC